MLLAVTSMLMNPQCTLNEVSLKTDTRKTRLWIDGLRTVLGTDPGRNLTLNFPRSHGTDSFFTMTS